MSLLRLLVDIHLNATRDATTFVIAAEDLEDSAAIDFHVGATRSDIGAIAAAKHVADGVAAINGDIGAVHRGRIAAAINVFDAVVAVMDLHHRHTRISSLVAAAKHMAEGITGIGLVGAIDVHIHGACRVTIGIVAAIDRACDRAAVDGDLNGAVNESGNSRVIASDPTQAAAIEVAADRAAIKSDIGATRVGQGTAAINVMGDGAPRDIHRSGTRHVGQIAAAVDIAAHDAVGLLHQNRGGACHFSGITTSIHIAADDSLVGFVFHVTDSYLGITRNRAFALSVISRVTIAAAIHTSGDGIGSTGLVDINHGVEFPDSWPIT